MCVYVVCGVYVLVYVGLRACMCVDVCVCVHVCMCVCRSLLAPQEPPHREKGLESELRLLWFTFALNSGP